MPAQPIYITGTCRIQNGNIWINGRLSYTQTMPVNELLVAAYKHFNVDYPKFYKMDQLARLGFLATELILQQQNIKEQYADEEVGIVFSNASASLDADLHYYETVKNIPSPAQFVYTLPNIVIGEISIRHKFKGENAFFVSDTPDAALLHFYVSDLFQRKKVKACISGWVELLDENYDAVIFLVTTAEGELFNIDNINKNLQIN